ncbi:MAG: hypothetical protein BGO54_05285 [Sphingobacteriales bacterium 46-32]|nr:MAG: hypothetical protein BGO54_05285 [Sphingobacteriales bacterium 46-32]
MNKLKLINFKAFEDSLAIALDNRKNLLLYGENGAGKSSIYEALKVIFFKARLESQLSALTPEDLEQKRNELWSSYDNKITSQAFNLEINDTDHHTFDRTPYQVFLISIEELSIGDRISLQTLLKTFFFDIPDIPGFCNREFQRIQDLVNASLTTFQETVQIEIDNQDAFTLRIIDPRKHIETKTGIRKYFNEAKLNLILLLVLLNAIDISKDSARHKILVLDDFITSLDASNRTFLIKDIFAKFQDSQILILTHNVSFYNLIMFMVRTSVTNHEHWAFANLYEINNAHKLYIKSEIERSKKIKADYEALPLPQATFDIENIGNRIRKKFETLLYEYSKLLMIGAVEESKKILERLSQGKPVYFKYEKNASDLVDTIEAALADPNDFNIKARLQAMIDEYKLAEFANFRTILKELKLYQKVTMHPMSHGVDGINTFTTKEIANSITILEKMEGYLKDIVDSDVSVV